MEEIPAQDLTGLVISYFGSSVAVLAPDGQVFQCQLHRNQALPVVGDQVHWHLDKDSTGTVISIDPRRNVFSRGDGHGKLKAIAANIDYIVIVMAPPPVFSEHLIDRYLIAAELLGIKPMIVVNKIDLLDEAALVELKARLAAYVAIPYTVVLASTREPGGLDTLVHALSKQAAVLVGPSGVGKSSIINAIGQDLSIRVSAVSKKGAGKHTTTATRLYQLPEGGCLIDSPGVREFNLWPVTAKEILRGFPEFTPYAMNCRFRDCAHLVEPGCKVQEAIEAGKISAKRKESYQELIKTFK